MSETYLEQLKRERDAQDRQAIVDALPLIRQKMAEGVERRDTEIRVSVDKRVLSVLRMRESENKDFFYEEMSKLGLDGSAIKWDAHTERPPYDYWLVIDIGE